MTSLMEQREQLARDRYQIDRVMAETIVAEPETPPKKNATRESNEASNGSTSTSPTGPT